MGVVLYESHNGGTQMIDKTEKEKIRQQSRELAAKVVRLYRRLTLQKKETVLSEELLRSGGGAGANLARADCAINRADQIQKIYAALQDGAEAKYWLEVLNDNEYLTEFEFKDTLKACDDMGKTLIGLIKTLRETGQKT
jgi:four helix bundle protein